MTLLERLVQSEAKAVQELGPYHAYLDLLVALLSLKVPSLSLPLLPSPSDSSPSDSPLTPVS